VYKRQAESGTSCLPRDKTFYSPNGDHFRPACGRSLLGQRLELGRVAAGGKAFAPFAHLDSLQYRMCAACIARPHPSIETGLYLLPEFLLRGQANRAICPADWMRPALFESWSEPFR